MSERDATPYGQRDTAQRPLVRRGGVRPARMMRTPTPQADIYRWHWKAMNGLEPEIHEIEPEAGWFRMRLIKGGPFVPVEIWVDQVIDAETGELAEDEWLLCTVNGTMRNPLSVWTQCRPISKDEFDAMKRGEIGAGSSDPMQKVNLMKKAIGPNG